jgi:hypothetical protein
MSSEVLCLHATGSLAESTVLLKDRQQRFDVIQFLVGLGPFGIQEASTTLAGSSRERLGHGS